MALPAKTSDGLRSSLIDASGDGLSAGAMSTMCSTDQSSTTCTIEQWASQVRNALAEHVVFKNRVKQWHATHSDVRIGESLNPDVIAESESMYAEAQRHNEGLQSQKAQAKALGFADSTIAAQLDKALIELRIVLAFSPGALRQSEQLIISSKWKTLADVKHELGHQSH